MILLNMLEIMITIIISENIDFNNFLMISFTIATGMMLVCNLIEPFFSVSVSNIINSKKKLFNIYFLLVG